MNKQKTLGLGLNSRDGDDCFPETVNVAQVKTYNNEKMKNLWIQS